MQGHIHTCAIDVDCVSGQVELGECRVEAEGLGQRGGAAIADPVLGQVEALHDAVACWEGVGSGRIGK